MTLLTIVSQHAHQLHCPNGHCVWKWLAFRTCPECSEVVWNLKADGGKGLEVRG